MPTGLTALCSQRSAHLLRGPCQARVPRGLGGSASDSLIRLAGWGGVTGEARGREVASHAHPCCVLYVTRYHV